ncbi:transglycosylase [Burkholderia lata]|uniref:Transglycosylase n=1 Tax=Burkholderia lata (strain ATCC 17760 / DSM 23089 / LMG 22485 / NCIMB 9086 / R18194 / 383) TaxID=482957 RepID=A0A6P2W8L9_BURL3|nr:hypothetical protein [Burkholderia lata]VWC96088.1 transglycosylase [Burkholderia lata]
MGFNSFMPDDDYRVATMGAMNPVEDLRPDGMFSGTGGAFARGVVGGGAAVARTLADAANAFTAANMQGGNPEFGGIGGIGSGMLDVAQPQVQAADMTKGIDDSLKRTMEWAKIDPRVTGTGAQTIGSLAHGLTVFGLGSLAGGPEVGAGLTGATEGYSDYRDKVAAGVDPATAAESAFGMGAFAAAGAFLPMKFGGIGVKGLAASMAGGAAVNTGFGIAQRYLSSEILSANGYKDMADQYKPLDAQSMIADAVLGAAFGGFAHAAHGAEVPAAERPGAGEIEQALDVRRQEAMERAGPGIPIDPQHANLNLDLQDQALGNMLRGRPTDVPLEQADAMVEHSLADPERVQLNNAYVAAGEDVHGSMADFSEPARAEAAPLPYELNDAGEPITRAEGAGTMPEGMSPIAQETANQLAIRHPDLEVQMPDGRTVRAADLQTALQNDMASATADSKLHDVAVSCFLRTL